MKDYEILVNKEHILDKNYIPEDLIEISDYVCKDCNYSETDIPIKARKIAVEAFEKLNKDANKVGIIFYIDSAYRSYNYQDKLLKRCIEKSGENAYMYCAIPGTSEHQTGLALDLGYIDKNNKYHMEVEENTKEYQWLKNNSYKYGFILRYPKGKEKITGYMFEPWHYRFIGKKLSKEIFETEKTLEEYFYNF